jgi:hypothetical protein
MSEESEAKRDGATLQPNSGRGKHKKGDAILGPYLIDYKEYAKSFGVSISGCPQYCIERHKGWPRLY